MADLMDAALQNNRQVADNIDQWGKLYDNSRVADMMVKANPDLVQRMGFQSPEQFKSLSAQDKIAATTGYIKNQGVQEFQARMNDWNAQAEQRTTDAVAQQDAGTFISQYGKNMQEAPEGTDPKTVFYQTMSQMPQGFNAGRAMPKIMDSLAKWQAVNGGDDANNPVQVDNTSVPGSAIVTRKRGSGFQIIPTGSGDGTAQEVKDEDGNLLGHQVRNSKGGYTFVPVKTPPVARPTFPAGSKPTTINGVNYMQDDAGNLYKVPAAPGTGGAAGKLSALLNGGAAPAGNGGSPQGAAAEPLPMAGGKIDASKLETGKVYQTVRGPATWDGKQFNQ